MAQVRIGFLPHGIYEARESILIDDECWTQVFNVGPDELMSCVSARGLIRHAIKATDSAVVSDAFMDLPVVPSPQNTRLVLGIGDDHNFEYLQVVVHRRNCDLIAVVRGIEGTTARPWPAGSEWAVGIVSAS